MNELTRRDWLHMMAAAGAGSMMAVPHPSRRALAAPASNPSQESDQVTLLLITGWATHNIGDIGHTPGTLRYLEEHFAQADGIFWLHAFNPEITSMVRQKFSNVALVEGGDIDEIWSLGNPFCFQE